MSLDFYIIRIVCWTPFLYSFLWNLKCAAVI